VLLSVLTRLLDPFFPRRCIGCGKKVSLGLICDRCSPVKREPIPFEAGFFGYPYEGIYRKLLHELKFHHRRDVLPLIRSLVNTDIYARYDWVIPVPSHWIRRLEHGCDPVHLIFQQQRGRVKRRRYTPAFHSLGKDERAKIIRQVFVLKAPERVKGVNILIVDDIYTTGATYREIKQTLLSAGAASVDGYFLTRA